MVSERHAVQRNDFEFLAIEMKIDVAVGGGVDNAPELALARVNADRGTNFTVHGENSICFIRLASARRGLGLQRDARERWHRERVQWTRHVRRAPARASCGVRGDSGPSLR